MHNQFPAQGTPEWYRRVEQLLSEHDNDVQRLWAATPQNPDNVGEAAQNPEFEGLTTSS